MTGIAVARSSAALWNAIIKHTDQSTLSDKDPLIAAFESIPRCATGDTWASCTSAASLLNLLRVVNSS